MSKIKYTKEFLEPLVKKYNSITEILRGIGLHANSGSHSHISRVIRSLGLDTSHFKHKNLKERCFTQLPKEKDLRDAAKNSVSIAEMLRKLGLKEYGSSRRRVLIQIKKCGVDTSHFIGQSWNKGKKMEIGKGGKKNPKEFLVLRDEFSPRVHGKVLKNALLEIGRLNQCEYCGQKPFWNEKELVLEVDHKNGNFWDNREENLAISCPNCHSQLPTFGIKNFIRVSEQQTNSA